MRGRAREVAQEAGKTGNAPNPFVNPLNKLEMDVMAIIGEASSYGLPGRKEAGLSKQIPSSPSIFDSPAAAFDIGSSPLRRSARLAPSPAASQPQPEAAVFVVAGNYTSV